MARLAILFCLGFAFWAIRRDVKSRPGVSAAVWIPTLWIAILTSRPVTTWVGIGGIRTDLESSMEGSPLDALFFLTMILAAIYILSRRGLDWNTIFSRNWA